MGAFEFLFSLLFSILNFHGNFLALEENPVCKNVAKTKFTSSKKTIRFTFALFTWNCNLFFGFLNWLPPHQRYFPTPAICYQSYSQMPKRNKIKKYYILWKCYQKFRFWSVLDFFIEIENFSLTPNLQFEFFIKISIFSQFWKKIQKMQVWHQKTFHALQKNSKRFKFVLQICTLVVFFE